MTSLSFTSSPQGGDEYGVADVVEVMCDHEDNEGERIRGWLTGIVVQVDDKIVAVQFENKVYLTNGWMVPDHVLWFPLKSADIRRALKKKRRPRST